jgi:hypothetical protein
MKGNLKRFFVEFVASLLFTLPYYVLVGRTTSSAFDLNILQLAALVSFIYIIAVFVSSYRFEADVFPFYSLLRCWVEKSLKPLYINIPAQFLGTVAGFILYHVLYSYLLKLSPFADLSKLATFEFPDPALKIVLIAVLMFILIYSIQVIRHLFLLKGMTGTLLIAVLVFVLTSITLPINEVSIATWWQDLILSYYHYLTGAQESLISFYSTLTFLAALGATFLAFLKSAQFQKPPSDQQELAEPGEQLSSFSRDYDI